MADRNIFNRLRRLFSTNIIIRKAGENKVKVADVNKIQYGTKRTNYLLDRYSRLHTTGHTSYGYPQGSDIQALRLQMFRDYEEMDADSIIASALDIYADESTIKDESGEVLSIRSSNEEITELLRNLFYDVLNIEFNLWPWVRNMTKYGDFFMKLNIAENLGVVGVQPISPYEIMREEGLDPSNPNLVQFRLEGESMVMGSGKMHHLENYEVAHFRLLSDSNFVPYGKSMVESARKTWKQLMLMEDAMLVHRIMRAPEKRVFKIDIGNIPPNEVDNYMQQIINKSKKVPLVDQATGEYNLKYNMQNITEDFYVPVRGGDSGTQIDTLAGLTYEAVEDIEYLRNKMMASLRVPKAFLGYEEQVEGKATLAAEDVRFARTIERIQRIVTSELTKIAIVHLYAQGFTDDQLVNFELSLTNSSTIYEQEKVALWNEKVSVASSMITDNIMSTEWIYENLFNFDDKEVRNIRKDLIDDHKRKYRYEQIEQEGNDPVKTNQSFGTPHDLAILQSAEGGNGAGQPPGGPPTAEDKNLKAIDVPDGGWDGAGRPPEGLKYKTDDHPLGRDPIGQKGMHYKPPKEYKPRAYQGGSPVSMEHVNKIVSGIKRKRKILSETLKSTTEEVFNEKKSNLLDESNILDDKDVK